MTTAIARLALLPLLFCLPLAASPAAEPPAPSAPVTSGLSPGIPLRLSRATSVRWPAGRPDAPTVFVFMDPQCPYCHRLWETIRALPSRSVEFRFLMVGVIAPQSEGQAAAILQAQEPLAALAAHEAGLRSGGIAPAKSIDPAIAETLRTNAALMGFLGAVATPTIVIQDRKGVVSMIAGLPSRADLEALLASVQ